MADYVSTLTGSQIDAALTDMAYHNSEAYAVGERDGVAVDSGDVAYHNNAKYYAQIATSTVSPGDIGDAVRWDTDQSTVLTDTNKAQARANIAAGCTNPNLLDNPWFTVNQRGTGTYPLTTAAYFIDRWKSSGGNTLTINTNGIKMVSGTGTHQNLIQANPVIEGLLGKTVTASVMSQTGVISSVTFTLPSSISSGSLYDGGSVTVDGVALKVHIANTYSGLPSGYAFWLYSSATAQTVTYRAVKLELGTVSTLANDTPPNYAEELAKCQRYFVRFAPTAYTTVWNGVCINTSTFAFNITTPVPMRVSNNMTISFTGTLDFVEQTTSGAALRSVTGLTVYVPVSNSNLLRVLATTASTLGTNNLGCIYTYAYTPVIDISADL